MLQNVRSLFWPLVIVALMVLAFALAGCSMPDETATTPEPPPRAQEWPSDKVMEPGV